MSKSSNESNVDTLLQIAFGDDEAASTQAIRKIFLKGNVKTAAKPKWTPSPAQVQAAADRDRLNDLRKHDPRESLRFWKDIRRGVVTALAAEEARRRQALDDGTIKRVTFEAATEDLTPAPMPEAAPVPALPDPHPGDVCICNCVRANHPSGGGCRVHPRCHLFVEAGDAR